MKKINLLLLVFIMTSGNLLFASHNTVFKNTLSYYTDDVVTSEDFNSTLLEVMNILDDNNYIRVNKVTGGYTIKIIAGANPSARELKCCGTGVSFANCVKGLLEEHVEVTVSKCRKSCGTYCAYIP